jgi:hypothetical protein
MSKDLILKESKQGNVTSMVIAATPEAIMRAFAEKYSLILETGDVMLIGTNPYITKSGLLRLSHIQKLKSVIPKRVEINYEKGWAHYECIVTTADDRVYKDEGFCDMKEGKRRMQDVIGTAITRARNRALAAATAVPNCTFEELPEEVKKKAIDITEFLEEDA